MKNHSHWGCNTAVVSVFLLFSLLIFHHSFPTIHSPHSPRESVSAGPATILTHCNCKQTIELVLNTILPIRPASSQHTTTTIVLFQSKSAPQSYYNKFSTNNSENAMRWRCKLRRPWWWCLVQKRIYVGCCDGSFATLRSTEAVGSSVLFSMHPPHDAETFYFLHHMFCVLQCSIFMRRMSSNMSTNSISLLLPVCNYWSLHR